MLFLTIPLLLIFSSLVGIFVVVWKKRLYLTKLSILEGDSEGFLNGHGFSFNDYLKELFPEVKNLLDSFKIDEYKSAWLMELEKSLRKTRLIFLRVDRFSDKLIGKIRKIHVNGQLNGDKTASIEDNVVVNEVSNASKQDSKTISLEFLRNEEQKLIIAIAQNPKNPDLYEALGDLYVEMVNFNDAKESYEAAIELGYQNESLKSKLSSVLEKVNIQN